MNETFNTQISTNEIEPAGVIATSPETVNFFKDYTDRYRAFNGRGEEKILRRIKNNRTRIADQKFLDRKGWAGYYNPKIHTVNVPLDVDSDTYTHELVHSLNDSIFNSLHRSIKEKQLLNKAYKIHANPLYKLRHGNNEKFTVNTQVRRLISESHNNALGDDLNNIIKNVSDADLIQTLNNSGYLEPNDYYKMPVSSAKELYNTVPGANYDPNTGKTVSWKDESFKTRKAFRKAFRKNSFASTLGTIDSEKINALREALIKVAKQGGIL